MDVAGAARERRDENEHLKTVIEQAWSSHAGRYDQMWGHGLRTDVERRAWLTLLDSLFPGAQPVTVLDVGCGTGFLSLLLAELGHSVMGPFDVVISRHLLWTLLHPQRAVRAWTALAVPGGRVVAIDILGMLAPTTGTKLRTACGQAIQSLAESAEPATMGLWRALRTLVQSGDPHYPTELASRLPLQAARTLDPVKNIWQRAGLEDIMAEELIWLDEIERSQMPAAVRMQYYFRRYLIEGRRPVSGTLT